MSKYYSRTRLGSFVHSWRLFCTATYPLGHVFCSLSGDRRLSISRRLKMYYFYGKVNRGHVVCPLYRGGLYLRESVVGGSTVLPHSLTSSKVKYFAVCQILLKNNVSQIKFLCLATPCICNEVEISREKFLQPFFDP